MVGAVRVLVVYASTRGGTAGLAHMVADAFVRHHVRAEVRRAADAGGLDGYDAVIVGGALYHNRWHPDAVAFVGRRRKELRTLPVWFFSSGPLDDSARSGAIAPVPQVITLARDLEIRGHMTFGGLLDKRPPGLLGRFTWGPEGDFRDRGHVAEWVDRIAGELQRDDTPTVRVVDSAGQPVPPPPARRPTVVVVPYRDAAGEAVESQFTDDEVVDLRSDPRVDRLGESRTRQPSSLSRLRRYLTLDDEPDDEGLDLLGEPVEPPSSVG
ncbi:MAG TPA: flavodoxin domain-containing protein [Mycobacteriales bacterium]|nr:flavodoxin domain-containing protein [Mycobacteriales bacterium]